MTCRPPLSNVNSPCQPFDLTASKIDRGLFDEIKTLVSDCWADNAVSKPAQAAITNIAMVKPRNETISMFCCTLFFGPLPASPSDNANKIILKRYHSTRHDHCAFQSRLDDDEY